MQRRALETSGRRLSLVVLSMMAMGIVATLLVSLAMQPLPGVRAQETVEIWVLGVEFKGTAGAGEPFIDEGDKVERYVFIPSTIRVQQGQNVKLNFLGINGGGGHTTHIEHYVPTPFTFMRNETVTKEFVADRAGTFHMTCTTHPPTMNAEFIVEASSTSGIAGVDLTSAVLLGAQATLFVVTLVIVLLRRPGR
jgi:plastocyanin